MVAQCAKILQYYTFRCLDLEDFRTLCNHQVLGLYYDKVPKKSVMENDHFQKVSSGNTF